MRGKRKIKAGKRKIKSALAEHSSVIMNEPTPASDCECGHEELPAAWHLYSCPVAKASRRDHMAIRRGV